MVEIKVCKPHMELLIEKRNEIAEELFEKYRSELNLEKVKKNLSSEDKMKPN